MGEAVREALWSRLDQHGQAHVLRFWDGLGDDDRRSLGGQIDSIDLDALDRLLLEEPPVKAAVEDYRPEPFVRLPHGGGPRGEWDHAREAGKAALREGRVAAMVVAGGQGTRLGFDGPKGAFPIGPVTQRTLFQIHAEKVLAATRRYGRFMPLLVMTSPANDAATRAFFAEHGNFGLASEAVRFFAQGEMPAVDDAGRLVLESPGRIFMSPNGHGGALKALWDSGTVQWLEERGIGLISYFQVDNPLVRVIDETFVGFTDMRRADMSLKLLERTIPDEKLGIWLRCADRPCIVEYSDMPQEKMRRRDPDGTLRFKGGSIAIHCFSVPFVRRLNERGCALPFHKARKKVPYVDAAGAAVDPKEPNATKFEMFVFDALFFAERAVAVETAREEEFSPVKNAAGTDSPQTARRDMSRLYGRWLAEAGVNVPVNGGGYPVHPIEISPLYADGPEDLKRRCNGHASVTGPLALKRE
jgi:UDP-N-acetylglucosamine/UDP-N-acetylgalactosamine diphosphorylase